MIKDLEIVVEDASSLAKHDQQAFAMVRRVGFGASDSSKLLGVNPFADGTVEKLIEEKRSKIITASELAIGQMVNVRKGNDLEPIIMRKFVEKYGILDDRLIKPKPMYRIPNTPLLVNFDGVLQLPPIEACVECKYVSAYGGKYYDLTKAMTTPHLDMGGDLKPLGDEVNALYLTARAQEAGIPVYYYTQVQQQLMALNSPFGYLAALFDKDWELRVFKIIADPMVQQKLKDVAEVVWARV